MRSPIAYSPRPGPLPRASALAATVYLGSFAIAAFSFSNPLVLAGAGVAVATAGLAAGAGRAVAASARWSLTLGIFIVAVNALASQRGDTVLVRGGEVPVLGQIDVSSEALVEGAMLALRIGVVLCAFAVHSACVDPDRLFRLVRPLARHSAFTATLIARLVPLASADYSRLRDAVALRGPAAAPVGRATIARRLVAGSLDRAIDVAAALELRGYARGVPRAGAGPRPGRHSGRFLAAGLAVIALSVAIRVAGGAGFDAYPTVSFDTGPAALGLAIALPLFALAPFAGTGFPQAREGGRT